MVSYKRLCLGGVKEFLRVVTSTKLSVFHIDVGFAYILLSARSQCNLSIMRTGGFNEVECRQHFDVDRVYIHLSCVHRGLSATASFKGASHVNVNAAYLVHRGLSATETFLKYLKKCKFMTERSDSFPC